MIQNHTAFFKWVLYTQKPLKNELLLQNLATKQFKLHPEFQQKHRNLRRKVVIHRFVLMVLLIQGVHFLANTTSFKSKQIMVLSLYLVAAILNSTGHVVCSCYVRYCSEACLLLNGIFQFPRLLNGTVGRQAGKRKLPLRSSISIIFAYCAVFSLVVVPAIFVFVQWPEPCNPSIAGFWMLPECFSETPETHWLQVGIGEILKVSILLGNLWMWWMGFQVISFTTIGIGVFSTVTITEYLQMYFESIKTGIQSYEHLVVGYRSLELLASLHNDVMRGQVSMAIAPAAILLQAISGAVLIQLELESTFLKIMLLLINLDTVLAMIGYFGGMSNIYTKSKETIWRFANLAKGAAISEKLRRKFFESGRPLRAQFGSINFFDKLTPLHFIDYANDLTVQMLLVSTST